MSVIQKLILAFLALALLPIMIVGFIMYLSISQTLTNQIHNQLKSVATIQANRLTLAMTRQRDRITGLAANSQFQTALADSDQATLIRLLSDTKASSITLKNVAVANPAGSILASTTSSEIGRSLASQDYFRAGLKTVDVSSYLFAEPDNTDGINLVAPVTRSGAVLGVIVIHANLESLLSPLQSSSGLGTTGELFLTKQDAVGNNLYLTPLQFDRQAALKRVTPHGDAQSPFSLVGTHKAATVDSAVNYRGHTVVAAVQSIAGTNWRLVAQVDRSEAYTPLSDLLNTFLILIFVVLVVTVFVALFVARVAVDPVVTLSLAAERMKHGDLSQRVAVNSRDEFGSLATAFNNMAAGLEKIDQSKAEFVALMSHQLRTPTTAVKGFIAMLLDGYAGKLTAKQAQILHSAFDENERQVHIINDILLVAAANIDQMAVLRTSTDLGQIIADIIAGQTVALKQARQTLSFTKPSTLVMADADADKIRMAIENVITNAIKYSPEDTHIQVALKRSLRHATIQVIDQGFGIAPADMPKLFQRFARFVNPHTTQAQGSGLGLYLVKKIIELHHGHVTAKSELGKGTTITLRLPLRDPAETEQPAASTAPRVAFELPR